MLEIVVPDGLVVQTACTDDAPITKTQADKILKTPLKVLTMIAQK